MFQSRRLDFKDRKVGDHPNTKTFTILQQSYCKLPFSHIPSFFFLGYGTMIGVNIFTTINHLISHDILKFCYHQSILSTDKTTNLYDKFFLASSIREFFFILDLWFKKKKNIHSTYKAFIAFKYSHWDLP